MNEASTQLPEGLAAFATELADAARETVLRGFRGPVHIEHKQDSSPVTDVDRAVEQRLREQIATRFPDHGVCGEEFPDKAGDGVYTWVLDPIDGTKGFITGKPLFGTLIALLQESRPVLGVIDIPALAERWVGLPGATTTLNGVDCATSTVTGLADATVYASSPDMFDAVQRVQFDRLCALARFRCFGADCYAYGLLTSGHTELVVEADMQPYDYLAMVPVVENAGGMVTDWAGRPLTRNSDGTVLAAANPKLHEQALACLSDGEGSQ